VAGGWRGLYSEERHNLYGSPTIVWVINQEDKMVETLARMGGMRNVYKILAGKPEGKRPLGRPICRWEDNISMDLKGTRWEVAD
jgi:hypothetical protein